MKRQHLILVAALSSVLAWGSLQQKAEATVYMMEDFSTYSDGALVGQNGWQQYGASTSLPLQVSSGALVIPPGQNADNQDAFHNHSAGVISAPGSGTTTVYYGLKMSVQDAPVVDFTNTYPSYFAATATGNNASGFANERLFASESGSGFVASAKVTGQFAAPYGTGATELNYDEVYNIILAANMVSGSGNDTIDVYVNPTSGNVNAETPYLSVAVGGGSDPSGIGSFIISQFSNATVFNAGVSIYSIVMADTFAEAAMVPEPSSFALVGLAGLFALSFRSWRRRP